MTAASFFAIELTCYVPGIAAVVVGQGHGTHPHGALADQAAQPSRSTVIKASDLGYRTTPSDATPTSPYPPIINKAFQMSRALNLDPSQSGAGAAWGSLALSNAGGMFDVIAGSWNSDGRALRVLWGFKEFEDSGAATSARASPGTYVGADFNLHTAASAIPRWDYTSAGAIHNPQALDIVAGTPGTPPIDWTVTVGAGLSSKIVDTGSEDGIPYLDVRFFGTTTGAVDCSVAFSLRETAAVSGQTWTFSVYGFDGIAGSLVGIVGQRIAIEEWTRADVLIVATSTPTVPVAADFAPDFSHDFLTGDFT